MTALDRLISEPQMVEVDRVDLAAAPAQVWEAVRHGDLGRSPLIRALFAIRTRSSEPTRLRLEDMVSSPAQPGFQLLVDQPPHELAVGAIGKVWQNRIPFVHVEGPEAFARFGDPGFLKVAWALRVSPRERGGAHLEFELRTAA